MGQAYSLQDEARLKCEILSKVKNNKLEIALAAFPFKIQNPLKTISIHPDMGEMVVLNRLKGIQDIFEAKGINLQWNVIADGCFYSDELLVSKDFAQNYLSQITKLSSKINLNAKFFELEELVGNKNIKAQALNYLDDLQRQYVLRTAGMINTTDYSQELEELFEEHRNIPRSMEALLDNCMTLRKQCEKSAALYQGRKNLVEEQNIFEKYFASSVRASIQVDTSRNLLLGEIDRPLAIRITQSKGKNLFPWLGVGYFDGKEWSNTYFAEARAKGLKLEVIDGLMFYQK